MNCLAALERDTSLEAMWHAYRAFHFLPQNELETDPSIRGAHLEPLLRIGEPAVLPVAFNVVLKHDRMLEHTKYRFGHEIQFLTQT
jgi:hypothetical protein